MSIWRSRIWLVLGMTAVVAAHACAQQIPLDALLRGGRIHYDGQRYERAREQFQKALDTYGATAEPATLAQIHLWLGLSDAQLNQRRSAADHFLTALNLDTALAGRIRANEQWQYYAYTSLIFRTREDYGLGEYENALTAALAAVKVDPQKPQGYTLVANAYSALGRFDEMRRTAEDLLKLDAQSAEALSLLGLYFLQKPDSLWPTPEARLARFDSVAYYYDRAIAVYTNRLGSARKQLATLLKTDDQNRIDAVANQLIQLSRRRDQSALEEYIKRDLGKERQLTEVAQIASQLFFAAQNINSSASRAGTAMLRAATESKADASERYRIKAESLFNVAVQMDPTDLTSLFDLGLTLYQAGKDSAAETSMQLVIERANLPLTAVPSGWVDSLLALVTPETTPIGYAEIPERLGQAVDSLLSALGRSQTIHTWLYFLDLKNRKTASQATIADTAGMFLSSLTPQFLEQVYLWLGSSQTALANSFSDAKRTDAARAKYAVALANLEIATKLNPASADAWQNIGICYRELGQNQKAFDAFQKADRLRKNK